MKSKWIIASVLIVVLIALCGLSLFSVWQGMRMVQTSGVRISFLNTDSVKAEAVEEQSFTVNLPASLTINNDFGDISVESGEDGQVTIKAEKTAWGNNDADAQQALAALKVVIEQRGDAIEVAVERPEEVEVFSLGSNTSSVKFTVTVPAETAVSLDTVSGNIDLSDVQGAVDVQTDFGNLNISGLSGAVTAASSSGRITAENLLGEQDVSLTTQFGEVNAQNVRGAQLTVETANGVISLRDFTASGLLEVSSDFGAISVIGAQAEEMEARSTNGSVTLKEISLSGGVNAQSDFGGLTLNQVDASAYSLKTLNGAIRVNGARGPLTAQSDFGDVEALNVENGTIDLASTNGTVTFSGSLGEGPHSVSSDFGSITLILPADSALDVDLQTEFGGITSDFAITVSGSLDAKHWQGEFNGGGEALTVKTNNGNITITAR